MITGKLKNQIDNLWTKFWTGGITNPLTVIEQISFLTFARMLDLRETLNERKAARLASFRFTPMFPPDKQHLRWSKLRHMEQGDQMLRAVRDELFPFFREELKNGSTTLGKYLADAQCLIPTGSLMVQAVNLIDQLPLQDRDTKGDLYEYLLSKLTTAGIQGQFRTPRHIIHAMVEMLDPKPSDAVCDPACGTGGFLIGVMDYLQRTYSSPDQVHAALDEDGRQLQDEDGKPVLVYPGDRLAPYQEHLQTGMFTGFDFDTTMLRVAAMNMMLHGIDNPRIESQDTLSQGFTEKFPRLAANAFDVVLANPPFKGSPDAENIAASLKNQVKTTKTELLFLVLFLRLLKMGGRAAVIVPDGVLFGSSKAHVGARQILMDENQLEAVISLPSGVFRPYAGVSTAVLVFTKGGRTGNVFFYDVEADGYSLDDKRQRTTANDLPDLVAKWKVWRQSAAASPDTFSDRGAKAFFVPLDEIRKNNYDLSINRYKKVKYEEVKYDPPTVILDRLDVLETEITQDLAELRRMLAARGDKDSR